MGRKAVFVDRDGTINRDVHYLDNPDRLFIYPTVTKGLRDLNKAGFLVIVITNQSGIARGLFSLETLERIHNTLERKLAESRARIDAIYFCPHHPDEGCHCRKPGTALLEKAIAEFGIDPTHSYFVGDRMMDVEAGHRVGCRTVLVPERLDQVEKEKAQTEVKPDHECATFGQGIQWILDQSVSFPVKWTI